MNSKKTCLSIAEELHSAMVARAHALGYPSVSAYMVGLVRTDIIDDTDHRKALRIADLPGKTRDKIDAQCLMKAEEAITRWSAADDNATAEVAALFGHVAVVEPRPISQLQTVFRGKGEAASLTLGARAIRRGSRADAITVSSNGKGGRQ